MPFRLWTLISVRVAMYDQFIARLLSQFNVITREGIEHRLLGIFRSDYMLTPTSPGPPTTKRAADGTTYVYSLKQVEINTISVSFAGHGTNICKLHSEINNRVPRNNAIAGIVDALALGHRQFCNVNPSMAHEHTAVMMVCQEGERNVFDQQLIVDGLREYVWQDFGPSDGIVAWHCALRAFSPLGSRSPRSTTAAFLTSKAV